MRRSKLQIIGIDSEIHTELCADYSEFLNYTNELGIVLTEGTNFGILTINLVRPLIEIILLERQDHFYKEYHKKLTRERSDEVYACLHYNHERGKWQFYEPPPFVSVDLKTKLKNG